MGFFNKLNKKLTIKWIFERNLVTTNTNKNTNYFAKSANNLNNALNLKLSEDINLSQKKLSKSIELFLKKNHFDIKDLSNIISGKIISNKRGTVPGELQKLLVNLYSTSNVHF